MPTGYRDVMPLEAVDRNNIDEIDQQTDRHCDDELDHPDDARDYDRRPGGRGRLSGDLQRGGRERLGLFAADDGIGVRIGC